MNMTYIRTGQGLITCCWSPLATADDVFKARPSLASPSPEGLPVSGAGPAWGLMEPLLSTGGSRVAPDRKYFRVQDGGGRLEASSWAVQVGACQEGWGGAVPWVHGHLRDNKRWQIIKSFYT